MATAIKQQSLAADPTAAKRQPVVVILGHVDHGKTTLLDYIRKTNVAAGESGGITQHIGAYEIIYEGNPMTFIDTPGHEAFNAMRSRGASVADIAVLVIAADEGLKPQTEEALEHISREKVPFIIAMNKIDKEGADLNKIKQALAEKNYLVEDWGGTIPTVGVSARTGRGVDELLQLIALMAEMEDITARTDEGQSDGVIIESFMDQRRGVVASAIIKNGTLNQDDYLATATSSGRVKILEDFTNKKITSAHFGMPVRIVGFDKMPVVGEIMVSARQESNLSMEHIGALKKYPYDVVTVENSQPVLELIIRADTYGSVEAIEELLKTIKTDKVGLRILRAEAGDLNESDVKMAPANAVILLFRTHVERVAQIMLESKKLTVVTVDVIYALVDEIKKLMIMLLPKDKVRETTGEATVLALFKKDGQRQIVGARLVSGTAARSTIEIVRDEEVAGTGKIVEVQQDKKTMQSITRGEFGMALDSSLKVAEGDRIVFFAEKEHTHTTL